jgi:hypothetical protein
MDKYWLCYGHFSNHHGAHARKLSEESKFPRKPIAISSTAPTFTNSCRKLSEDRFRSKNRQKWTSIGFATAILATTM